MIDGVNIESCVHVAGAVLEFPPTDLQGFYGSDRLLNLLDPPMNFCRCILPGFNLMDEDV